MFLCPKLQEHLHLNPKKHTENFVTNRQNFNNIWLVAGFRRKARDKTPTANHARVLEQRDAKAKQRQKEKI